MPSGKFVLISTCDSQQGEQIYSASIHRVSNNLCISLIANETERE